MRDLLDMVWEFRKEMKSFWPTPGFMDALRFADCEAREALDAWMRENRKEYKRNHEREADVLGELADCALMLLTALGPYYRFRSPDISVRSSMGEICWHVARAHRIAEFYGTDWQPDVECALEAIWSYPGMDLKEQLQIRMDRIRRKHKRGGG